MKEINAAGGILGRKINYFSMDTQTNPSVAKALAKGMGAKVKAAFETTLALQPEHADAYIALAANEAEKAANITLVHYNGRGRSGRLERDRVIIKCLAQAVQCLAHCR